MIIFGWNSFLALTKKPSEIGLEADLDKEIHFELRNQYFHLFWIPFFSLGQKWVMKKRNDKNHYEVAPEIMRAIESRQIDVNIPFYTFTGLILLFAAGAVFLIFSLYSSYQTTQARNESNDWYNKQIRMEIMKAMEDTYIRLHGAEATMYTLRVLSSDATNLYCVISNRQDPPGDYYDAYVHTFLPDPRKKTKIDTVTVSKEKLLAAFNADWDAKVDPIDIGPYKGLRMGIHYYIDMPIFNSSQTTVEAGNFTTRIKNIHTTAKILRVIPQNYLAEDFILDTLKSPVQMNYGDTLVLSGKITREPFSFSGYLIYQSKSNRIDTMEFNIMNASIKFETSGSIY